MIRILVEGAVDADIARGLLSQIMAPAGFEILIARQKLDPRKKSGEFLSSLLYSDQPTVVVYDQDSGTLADRPQGPSGGMGIYWCPAIPQSDAWLFSDDLALRKFVTADNYDVVERLGSPDSIPYPKVLRQNVLRGRSAFELASSIDLERAAARSPSLGYFLECVQLAAGMAPKFVTSEVRAHKLDRSILRALISEVYPGSATLFRSAQGEAYTADQMLGEIEAGTEIGREYATAMLRVARDLLKRQAERRAVE